jgi:hypothetical protein
MELRRHGIPYVFHFRMLYEIGKNSAELYGIPSRGTPYSSVEFRKSLCNFEFFENTILKGYVFNFKIPYFKA